MQADSFKLSIVVAWALLCPAPGAFGQPGFLDSTFGGTGMIQLGFGGASAYGQAAAVQSDGQLLVAGYGPYNNGSNVFVVLRLGTNTLPDPAFGTGGFATVNPPYPPVSVAAIAEQTNGQILVAGTENDAGAAAFVLMRLNANGSLDTSFGTNGFTTWSISSQDNSACSGMVLQPDGKIILVGTTTNIFDYDYMTLLRFYTNGALDFSYVGTSLGGGVSTGTAVALRGDGDILVGGYFGDNGVAAFTTNGTLDTTFGTNGVANIYQAYSIGALAIQPAGMEVSQKEMILVAGGLGTNVILARMSTSGVLDTTFAGVGYTNEYIATNWTAVTGMACIESSQFTQRIFKYLIVGQIYASSTGPNFGVKFMAARFNSDGSPDTTFGNSGVVLTAIPGSESVAVGGLAMPSGYVVLSGSASFPCMSDMIVARYDYSNGSLDTNFYGSGILETNFGNLDAGVNLNSAAIQSDGKIVLAGSCTTACGSILLALCRLNPDSSLDTSFGTGGKLVMGVGTPNQMALQPDGQIVVTGTDGLGNVVVARLLTNGILDASFGIGGSVTNEIGTNGSSPRSVALQADGKIVVGAYASVSNNDIAILRLNPNGSLDTNWNGTGLALTFIVAGDDNMNALAVQADGKVINAGYTTFSGTYEFSMVRFTTNGALDNSFGSSGRVATGASGQAEALGYGIALQPDHKIIMAGLAANMAETQGQIAVLRFTTNGTLDPTFGTNGTALASIGSVSYAVTAGLQSDGTIVAGCQTLEGSYYKFGVARFLTNGVLDPSYGVGGVNYFSFGTAGNEDAYSAALDSLGRLVLAGRAGNLFAAARVSGDPLLRFNSITAVSNLNVSLTGLGVPGASQTLLAATNPAATYSPVASVTGDASGNWQYLDTNALASQRFYRLSYTEP